MSQHALREIAISDSGFVFDPRSGATFTLNATGLVVVLALRDGMAIDAIVERLRTDFGEVPADVEDHVRDLLRVLVEHAILPAEAERTQEAA